MMPYAFMPGSKLSIPHDRWDPLCPDEVARLMAGVRFSWGIAGGHAIERFVGHSFRPHGDSDLLVFRDDQLAARQALDGFSLFAADPPGTLRPWAYGEELRRGVHDIWGYREGSAAWELQLMLQETQGRYWQYRRDSRIFGPRDEFFEIYGGLPCVRVEIQLLYKSKGLRPKDLLDFAQCLPLLGRDRRARLARYLEIAYSGKHVWLDELDGFRASGPGE